ncbi:hypothetical protein [Leptospira interrogans]|uniref:hypothetical protein n=1 Tax=Leptospira interrogans TaxID=173 RepID=UPI00046C5796|nr:hypothetical protein [Leptospira interrogans]OOB99605.1 hypothetical protein B0192_04610 [Leptospira interrogans serovar Australis]
MNQLPFPGNEVNSEHILYKKIDFIIENIKKKIHIEQKSTGNSQFNFWKNQGIIFYQYIQF